MAREQTAADLYLKDALQYLDESSPRNGPGVETNRLWHAVLYLQQACVAMREECLKKDEIINSFADRIKAQSDILSRHAARADKVPPANVEYSCLMCKATFVSAPETRHPICARCLGGVKDN